MEKIYKKDELVRKADAVQVIRVTLVKGAGTPEDLIRCIERFYLLDGTYIGEIEKVQSKKSSAYFLDG
jgi:hypothetical protein